MNRLQKSDKRYMDTDTQEQLLKERFEQLPQVVRDSITSADVQKRLRSVSDGHQLHIDQWAKLENEVMLTLLGFQKAEDLSKNIQYEVGITADIAQALATDINTIVFEPIREELERQLEHPEAKEKEVSGEEEARQQVLAGESADAAAAAAPDVTTPAIPGVMPATPAAPKPTEKAVRTPVSSSYTSRQPSTERKDVKGDPYREMP